MVKPLITRIRNRFNVSVAEVDEQESWQLATIGVSVVSGDKAYVDEILSRVLNFVNDGGFDALVLNSEAEVINWKTRRGLP